MDIITSNSWNDKFKDAAPIVLRVGLALVFLWFALQQLMSPDMWTAVVPDYVVSISHLSAKTLVYFNGIFELVFGALLLFGLFTRVAALLLALHLIEIILSVGYGAIGVRDFGLCVATFASFLLGGGRWSLDAIFAKKI